MSNEEDNLISLIDIVEIPRTYIEEATSITATPTRKDSLAQRFTKFERFLGALMHSKLHFGFRMLHHSGSTKLSYITPMNPTYPEIIKSAFMAHFPKFPTKIILEPSHLHFEKHLHLAIIKRVPKKAICSLNELSHIMNQSNCSSMYQVWATSRKPSRIGRKLAQNKYRAALERAQHQDTEDSWLGGKTTRTRISPDAKRSSKRLEELFRRMNAGRVLTCRVMLAFWGDISSESTLHSSLNALLSAISSDDKDEMLKFKIHSGTKAEKIMSEAVCLSSKVKGTDMLPSEAVPLFEIPSVDLGLRQGSPAAFSSSTSIPSGYSENDNNPYFQAGYITFGEIYRQGILDPNRRKLFPLELLRQHVAILGMTGSGKTVTKNRIVIDAWKNGISSLLIEPVKTDVRDLMGAIPSLRVFTVGLEQVSPFRLNPFHVEEGVHVQTHIYLLVSCFMAAWPVQGILVNHLRRVIGQTYTSKGWDLVANIRGQPISLEDFRNAAEKYSKRLKYGSEMSHDFRGAILTRAEDLCDPPPRCDLQFDCRPTNL